MTTTVTTTTIPLSKAVRVLREELERAIEKVDGKKVSIVRASVAVDAVDPLDWLRGQTLRPRIYWSGRDNHGSQTAAVGIADEITIDGAVNATDIIHSIREVTTAANDRQSRYYGGFRFDMGLEKPAEQWQGFKSARFILPKMEMARDQNRTTVTVNLMLPRDHGRVDEILDEFDTMLTMQPGELPDLPQQWTRADSPTEAGWENLLKSAMTVFAETDFRKLVLARKATLTSDENRFDAISVISHLRAANSHCFHALFEFGDTAFISSSPEMLYHREGSNLSTEAIAGTRPRGETKELDEHFKRELTFSDKDLREHDYVAIGIEQSLRPLCESLTIADREVLQLPHIQHLQRRFNATLKPGIADAELLTQLHPTAAVGTFPTRDAAKLLAVFEPIDRGWYAGPIGWIGADAAEFAVAIRSGLVHKNCLILYAGAGILEGSTATAEWNEIEIKLGNFVKALS